MNQFVTISSPLTRVPYVAPPVYQYDCGLKLKVKHAENLWEQAHFTIVDTNISLKTIAERDEDGAMVMSIPDTLLVQSKKIRCFLYASTEEYGRTVYEIVIPINARPEPASTEYTPEQIAYFDTLTAQLRGLIQQVDDVAGNAGDLLNSIGDVTMLDTAEKSNLVGAINEVKSMADYIGDVESLDTQAKLSLVDAINESYQMSYLSAAQLRQDLDELTNLMFTIGDPQLVNPDEVATAISGHFYNLSNDQQKISVSSNQNWRAYYFFAERDGFIRVSSLSTNMQLVIAQGVINIEPSTTAFTIDCVAHQRYTKADGTLSTNEYMRVSAGDFIGISLGASNALILSTDLFATQTKLNSVITDQTSSAAIKAMGDFYTSDVISYTDDVIVSGTINDNGVDNNSISYLTKNIRSDGFIELKNQSAPIKVYKKVQSYSLRMWFFDENKVLLGTRQEVKEDTYPLDGTKYIRYRVGNSDGIEPKDIANIKIYQYTVVGALKSNQEIKMCAMGDSITEGWYSYIDSNGSGTSASNRAKAWIGVFGDIKGFDITNIAIGGTGWVMNPQGKRSARRLAFDTDFSGYDLVTLAYGINDWKGQKNLGSMEDAVLTDEQVAVAEDGTGTIYSNMRYVIEKIIRDNPACKIFIITPLNSWHGGTEETNWGIGYSYANSKTLEDVFAAEKEIAEYYGIELIDMTHNSMINRKNIQKMLLDKVHPSEAAHRIIGYELSGKIHFA